MSCWLCNLRLRHLHTEPCETCRRIRPIYYDGNCATCHERAVFGGVR